MSLQTLGLLSQHGREHSSGRFGSPVTDWVTPDIPPDRDGLPPRGGGRVRSDRRPWATGSPAAHGLGGGASAQRVFKIMSTRPTRNTNNPARHSFRMGIVVLVCVAAGITACRKYEDLPNVTVPRTVSVDSVFGRFYRGNGLGYNLLLTLDATSRYSCDWYGCLGTMGVSTGAWSIVGNKLMLYPLMETGNLKERPLRTLDVLLVSNEVVLVKADDKAAFLKFGPSSYSCFSRVDERRHRADLTEAIGILSGAISNADTRIVELRSAIASNRTAVADSKDEAQKAECLRAVSTDERYLGIQERIRGELDKRRSQFQQECEAGKPVGGTVTNLASHQR